ncbi:MAG: hypothetical protein KC419_07170 [Anaerolineales bacterium]|nr:hypothetical protein [Anaerolineales bacterium]
MNKQIIKRILLFSILAIVSCCIILIFSPFAECLDIFGGHAPQSALEQIIQKAVSAAIQEDEATLLALSNENVTKTFFEVRPDLSENYTLTFVDDLAGLYEYRIQFDSGLELYVSIYGNWPTCVDFQVTEEEVLQNLNINSVQNVTTP